MHYTEQNFNIENADRWFVLQAIHGRTLIAQKLFSKLGIETFVPMERREIVVKGKKKVSKIVPILRSIIFVKSSLARIVEIKSVYKYLWYLSGRDGKTTSPIIVPDDQMQNFMDFTNDRLDQVEYIDGQELDLKHGERVRVTSGAFAGKEAILVKIAGKRKKQIVLALDDVLVVAVKSDNSEITIEKID